MNSVEYKSGGESEALYLPPGKKLVVLRASNWNSASATIQESLNVDANFVNSDDPYNTGNDLTRTANGPVLVFEGGCYLKLTVTGSPTSLILEYQDAE